MNEPKVIDLGSKGGRTMKADLELVQEAKSGSRQAFSELVGRHQRSMLRLALRMTRQWDLAEDIVQESFFKAYRGLERFGERASFKSWLYQITLNTARNKLRGLPRETVGLEGVRWGTAPTAELELERHSIKELIAREVERLPERQRMAVTLRIFEDLSFQEIAQIMECPYDTAKANFRHGLLKLKERIQPNFTTNPMLPSGDDTWVEPVGRTAEVEA
jgi:RNA polymerase sigma-70 factor (ECF subfamily)